MVIILMMYSLSNTNARTQSQVISRLLNVTAAPLAFTPRRFQIFENTYHLIEHPTGMPRQLRLP